MSSLKLSKTQGLWLNTNNNTRTLFIVLLSCAPSPKNLSYSLYEAAVVTIGGIAIKPLWTLNRFLAHRSAYVGSSHHCRYQWCAILYMRRSLCRRLQLVSARVRSLMVESYFGCGRCWLNTPLWPSNLSLDGRTLVAASVQLAPSEFSVRLRTTPDKPTKVSLAWGLGGDGTPEFHVTHHRLPSHLAIALSYSHGRVPGTWAVPPLIGTPWRVWDETVDTSHNNHEYQNQFYIVSDTAAEQTTVSGVGLL